MEIIKYKHIVWTILAFILIIIVLFAIPTILNYVLQIKTGLNVIQESTSESVWLTFWGTYLAAIGSTFLACVSFLMSKHAYNQNQKILNDNAFERLINRYNKLENYLAYEEKFFHQCYVDEIIEHIKGNPNDFYNFIVQKERELSVVSLWIQRYPEQEKANLYINDTGESLLEYGRSLRIANELYFEFINLLKENKELKIGFQDFTQKNKELIENIRSAYKDICREGGRLLYAEKKRILEYARNNKIECALL